MQDPEKKATIISKEFYPTVFHPYYFIRKGIFNAIIAHSNRLSGRIMDFGCGSKPYKNLFNYTEYIGVDYVNEGHSHNNEQIDVFYNGKSIPLPDNSFDCVVSSEVFEHIFNLPEILKELNRVMKQNGILLATCPFVWKEHETPNDFARYTLFALEDMLKRNGFKKIIMDKTGNFIEVMFQLQILFFYDKFYGKIKHIPLLNQLFKLIFIALPNLVGSIISRIGGKSKQMYLNNVIVFRKC